MALADSVFHVLTEFQFDVAGAVANANLLTSATEKISSAAQNAINSVTGLAGYVSSSLGISIGALGILGAAVKSSENFTKNQLAFANIISSNLDHLTGDVTNFNDRLAVSEKVLKNIAKVASDFSLDESSLLSTTKTLTALLAPKGLSGKNFEGSIDLARKFEKSAPTLGIDTTEAQGQLVRAIEGSASMSDTLFRRLVSETKALAPFRGGQSASGGANTPGSKSFNQLDITKRFGLIQEALGQFAKDSDVIAGNAALLSTQFTRLKNLFIGVNSVLQPLGDVIVPKLKMAFKAFIDFIDTKGRVFASSVARFLEPLIANPEQIYVTLKQLAGLRSNLESAGKVASTIGLVTLISGLAKFALSFGAVRVAVMGVARAIGFGGLLTVFAGIKTAGLALRNIIPILQFIGMAVGYVAKIGFILGFFTVLFQILERAKAIADVENIKYLISNSGALSEKLVEVGEKFKTLFAPLFIIFDDVARLFVPLFLLTSYTDYAGVSLDMVGDAIDYVSDRLITMGGILYGLGGAAASLAVDLGQNTTKVFSDYGIFIIDSVSLIFTNLHDIIIDKFILIGLKISEIFERILNLNQDGPTSFTAKIAELSGKSTTPFSGLDQIQTPQFAQNAGKAFNEGMDDFFRRALERQGQTFKADKNVSSTVTNIGKVEIRQDFKENMEPDRIAVSLMKTLQAVALNPTQASGNSLRAAQVSGGVR